MNEAVKAPVIAIDGPSGVGKGTLGRWLANRLNFYFLDSGSLYRLTALTALQQEVPLEDESQVAAVARHLDVRFQTRGSDGDTRVFLDGQDVSEEIRSEVCSDAASRVAVLATVRESLLQRQRDFRRFPGLVADGRDMGTVVFPDADIKIFLTASAEERAIRRYKQLREKGIDVNLQDLVEEIARRDERDAKRLFSPLRPALDAQVLDTTSATIEAVRQQVLEIVNEYFAGINR